MKIKKLLLIPALSLIGSGLSGCALLPTVTWVNWDGTVLEIDKDVFFGTVPTYNGATPTRPSTPEFEYKFKDWNKKITRAWLLHIEYKAEYNQTRRSYTVTFLNDDGTVVDEQVVPYGNKPEIPPDPDKPDTVQYDYTFVDWDKTVENVTGDVTYTAVYKQEIQKYKIQFVDYDGTVLKSDVLEYGETPSAPQNVTREPDDDYVYTFICWDKQIVDAAGDATYTACYDKRARGKFKVNYYIDGDLQKGGIYQDNAYEYENLALPKITADYYDVEWYYTPDLKATSLIKDYEIRSVGDNIIVYGKKGAEHEFKVKYDIGTAKFPTGHTYPSTVTHSQVVDLDEIDEVYAPLLDGHMFNGWEDENGNKVHELSLTTQDVLLTATFTVKTFEISFDHPDFAGVTIEATYNSDDYLEELAKPIYEATKFGYTFKGWSLDGKEPAISGPYLYTTDITLKPIFEVNEFTLEYVLNGGKLVPENAPTKYSIETYSDVLPVAEKYGYTFKGWEIEYGGKTQTAHPGESLHDVFKDGYLTFEVDSDQNFVLSALYTANNHQISYDYDGGVRVFTVTYMDGNTVVETKEVASGISTAGFKLMDNKDGYHFAGWTDGNGNLVLSDRVIDSDLTLYAKWNKVTDRDIFVPGTTDPVHEYDKTIAINGSETVPLYFANGSYLQVTSLIEQDVTITATASFTVYMAGTDQIVGVSVHSALSEDLNLSLQAGQSYSIRVVGSPEEIGSAVVNVNRTDSSTDIVPHFEISGTDAAQQPISCRFDEAIPHLDTLAKAGYVFDGWYYGTKLYVDGDVLDKDDDITFVAHWHAAP